MSINQVPTKSVQSLALYLSSLAFVLVIFIFLVSVNIIGYSVKDRCHLAQDKYDGDCTEALISYLEDENNDFRSRNSAVWALGQLGDERALPTLEKYYTSYDGERSDYNQELSQPELERAVGYIEGRPNITTFFWRFGEGID